jgi:arabinofuranosyltransferase
MPTDAPKRRFVFSGKTWLGAGALAAVYAVMLAHAHVYRSFLSDDALISFRYARRLVQGFGLSWTGNERVEGYTDLLWVLLDAAGGWLRFGYITTALVLSKIGVLMAVAAIGISPRDDRLSLARLLSGSLLLAASVPMAVWADGGLEHGFMTGVLAWGLLLLRRPMALDRRSWSWRLGLPFAALTLLRADGILLAALAIASCLVIEVRRRGRSGAVDLIPVALPSLLTWVGQLAFRRVYYGQWQPNTAAAKLALNADRLILGLRYLGHGYAAIVVLMVFALAASIWLVARGDGGPVVVAWTSVIGWSAYQALVGGDIFPGWRQLIFVLVPLAMLVADGFEQLVSKRGAAKALLSMVAVLAGAAMHLGIQRADAENIRAAREVWEHDGFSIGTLLRRAFGAQGPLHAVDAAGALPYWSDLPTLDMLGLNDAYIAHHPPASFGHGGIGHELGDGAYVFRRRPELISFNNAGGARDPDFLSGRQMLAIPDFHRLYQLMRVQGDVGNRATAEIWVRREDGALGIRRAPTRIDVPGYLLTGQESEATARLDPTGKLAAQVTWREPGILPAIMVPAGRWRATVSPASRDVTIAYRCEGRAMQRTMEGSEPPGLGSVEVMELGDAASISVAAAPRRADGSPAWVQEISFVDAGSALPTLRCAPARAPIAVRLSELESPKPENLNWSHPGNVLVDRAGLHVVVDGARAGQWLEISVDNNDVYTVELSRGDRSLWSDQVLPRSNGGGLAVSRLRLGPGTELKRGDELNVIPSGGDGAYSIGHIRIVDDHPPS